MSQASHFILHDPKKHIFFKSRSKTDKSSKKPKLFLSAFTNERNNLSHLLPKLSEMTTFNSQESQKTPIKELKNLFFKDKNNKITENKNFVVSVVLTSSSPTRHNINFINKSRQNKIYTSQILNKSLFLHSNNQNSSVTKELSVFNLIKRKVPNYSFSKTRKQNYIDQVTLRNKNQSLDFADVSKARDFLLMKNSYVPVYHKKSKNGGLVKKELTNNHEYLMKLIDLENETTHFR